MLGRTRTAAKEAPERAALPGEAYNAVFQGSILCIFAVAIHFAINMFVYFTVGHYTQMFLNSRFEALGFTVGTLAVLALYCILIAFSKKNLSRDVRLKIYFRIGAICQLLVLIHIAALLFALYIAISATGALPAQITVINYISVFKNLLAIAGFINIACGCYVKF